jgi:hypothetical protein
MKEQLIAATLLSTAACEGAESKVNATIDEIPIACVVSALTKEQRVREDALLKEHLASVREVRELEDGYAFRYDADVGLFARMAELVALEHRCCPFLDFDLEWRRASSMPWLHIRGGSRVKAFVVETFVPSTK